MWHVRALGEAPQEAAGSEGADGVQGVVQSLGEVRSVPGRHDEIVALDRRGVSGLDERGAKGVGEPGLIPTAPAIFGAIYHATGVRLKRAPATPDRGRAAILAAEGDNS